MSHELFKGIEDMKMPDDSQPIKTKFGWDENNEAFERDKKIFKMTSKLKEEPPEKRTPTKERGLQRDECKITPCPTGKTTMDKMCSVCSNYEPKKIRAVGRNMPEEPGKRIEPKDEEDNPTAS